MPASIRKPGTLASGESHTSVIVLASLASLTLVIALFLPFFWMEPGFGDRILEEILEVVFGQSLDPKGYSVVGGIIVLYEGGEWLIATVLLLFSVLFPVTKLLVLFRLLLWRTEKVEKWIVWLKFLGPWSMLDVFVVSLTVLAFKGFPGGTRVVVGVGYYFFLVSVLLGMLAVMLAKRTFSAGGGRLESLPPS